MRKTQKVSLVGVPIDLGAKNLGVDVGPDAFRYQGLVEKLATGGMDIEDLGDLKIHNRKDLVAGDSKMRYADEIVRVCEELANKTGAALKQNHKVVAIGGDHSLNLGVMSGASKALGGDLGLVYLDAHGDMNTPETTLTGNVHGMH